MASIIAMERLGPILKPRQEKAVHDRLKAIADKSFTDYNFSDLADVRNYIRNGGKINADDFLNEDTGTVGESHRIVTNINNDSVLKSMGKDFMLIMGI